MFSRNLIIITCLIAVSASGQNRIWSNGTYGKVDPREYLPESLYTNCVAWYCMNQNPAQFTTWGVPDGSPLKISGGQTNANSRPSWSSANQGALTFDRIDDAVDIGDQTYLDGKTALSVAAWVYLTTNVVNQSVFSKFLPTGNQRCLWFRVFYGDFPLWYRWNFVVYTDGTSTNASTYYFSEEVVLNTWQHIVFTWSASNTMTAYLNGVSKTLISNSSGSAPTSFFNSTSQYRIGNSEGAGTAFGGAIGDLAVFNRAITTTEATNLFLRSKAVYGL